MTDKYAEKSRQSIKDSKTDEEIDTVLDRVYAGGFEDGCEED
jgi:hypothetical protein